MTTATATITRAFERYVDTFQSLDPNATLRHLHVPSLILDARGPHMLSSADEAEAFLTKVMRDLGLALPCHASSTRSGLAGSAKLCQDRMQPISSGAAPATSAPRASGP